MKLLIGDKGNVDFDSPVAMNETQRKKFIDFLKNMFKVVKIEEIDNFRTERIGDKFFMREWTSEEYATLLELEDTNKVAEMLGRSWMSVDIKRGAFIPDFLAWTSQKGKDPLKDDVKELIKEFMKEKEQEIISRRERKNELRRKQKKIENLELEREDLHSEKKKDQIEFAIRIGQIKSSNAKEYIKVKDGEITSKIKKLKEEIEKMRGL